MLTRKLTRRITQALTRKATEPGSGGAASFDPASQFGSGEAGVLFYIPDDLSGLYQDAGTTPCTAAGQTVARWNDFSGHGKHLTLSGAVLRQHANGKWYIEANGLSTEGVTATVDFSGTDKMTIQVAVFNAGVTSESTIVRLGNSTSEAGTFDFGLLLGGFLCYRYASTAFGARGTPTIGSGITVGTCILDFAGTSQATENPTFRVNGFAASLTDYGTADTGSGNFSSTKAITVAVGQGRFNGGIFAIVVRGVASASDDYRAMETFLAGRSGASLPFDVAAPVSFTDTGAAADEGTHYRTSPFARSVFQTSATSLDVTAWNDLHGSFPAYTNVGVYVNGAYNQTIAQDAAGAVTKTITLPAGAKTVAFVNGLQTRPNPAAAPNGTYFVSVAANSPITQTFPAATNRLLVYGDSISVGDGSSEIMQDAWVLKVRQAADPDSVALEGWGYRSLHEDCVDATARAAFVSALVAYSPAAIWLAIGTNDYGLNKWNAASFGAAYAALLDDLHAALPAIAIYCQTPLLRSGEAANGSGSTLGDYRSQIATAVSTRTAYAVLVDGTSIMTTGDLADGVHPSTSGHALYAAAVIAELGL